MFLKRTEVRRYLKIDLHETIAPGFNVVLYCNSLLLLSYSQQVIQLSSCWFLHLVEALIRDPISTSYNPSM